MALEEGKKAPAFTLKDQNGDPVQLTKLLADKSTRVVMFAYPKAMTPGCTTESKDFTSLAPEFAKHKVKLLGISADSCERQKKFEDKESLGVTLLSDEDKAVLEKYGFYGEKTMYGKTRMGIIRSTVLIDEKGKVRKVWSNIRAKGHAQKVLDHVKATFGEA